MKHLKFKSGLSIVLACTILATFSIPAMAAEPNTEKEEVVYINLEKDGSVNEINVVNILTPDAGDGILDYGVYQGVRNMTTTDQVTYSVRKRAGVVFQLSCAVVQLFLSVQQFTNLIHQFGIVNFNIQAQLDAVYTDSIHFKIRYICCDRGINSFTG